MSAVEVQDTYQSEAGRKHSVRKERLAAFPLLRPVNNWINIQAPIRPRLSALPTPLADVCPISHPSCTHS